MDNYLEAEYESGYIHRQTPEDHSPYVKDRNYFYDILHKTPEPIHGKMVRLALVTPKQTCLVDWTTLPDNARPIYLKYMESDLVVDGQGETRCVKTEFGYQYNDDKGKNHKEIKEIR